MARFVWCFVVIFSGCFLLLADNQGTAEGTAPEIGACCHAEGCMEATSEDCSTLYHGIFLGVGSLCSEGGCTDTGACYGGEWGETGCGVRTIYQCEESDGGTWRGPGTDCDPNPCSTAGCELAVTDAGGDKTTCDGTPVLFGVVQTTGAQGTLTYSWSPSTYLDSDTSPQPTATPSGTCTPSSSITYTVTVTDTGAASCTDSGRVKLKICCNPAADAGADQTVCAGESTVLGACGSGIYSYRWSPPTYLSSATVANPTVSTSATAPSTSITYTLVVTELDCNSCTAGDQVTLTVCGVAADAGPDRAICSGGSAVIGPDEVPVGNYRYSWTPTDNLDDPSLANPTVATGASDPGSTVTYTLVVTELDCNSCTAGDEMVVRINANPACTITVDESASDGVVEPGSTHEAWIADPGAGATITWVVEDGGGNSLIVGGQGTATVSFQAPSEPTTIKIAVTVDDANGCGCAFDPPIDVQGPAATAGILRVLGYIPAVAGWGLTGLAAVVAGAGAWAVRRRKRK